MSEFKVQPGFRESFPYGEDQSDPGAGLVTRIEKAPPPHKCLEMHDYCLGEAIRLAKLGETEEANRFATLACKWAEKAAGVNTL